MKLKNILLSSLFLVISYPLFANIINIGYDADQKQNKIIYKRKTTDNGSIHGESIILYDNSYWSWGLKWDKGEIYGNVKISNSTIRANKSDNKDNDKIIWFSDDPAVTNDPARDFIITNGSKLIVDMDNNTKSIGISELSNHSSIARVGTGGDGLWVFAEPGARFTDCRLQDIKYLQCIGELSKFHNVSIENSFMGMYNASASRVDRYSISIPSTTSSWLSLLGPNSQFWDWNAKDIDINKIYLNGTGCEYKYGYTVSYQFVDLETDVPVMGLNVWYIDDRDDVGKTTKVIGRYSTNGDGKLTGRIDSRTGLSGRFMDRPTLYILAKQSKYSGTHTTSWGSERYRYTMVDVNPELHIRSYRHKQVDPNYLISGEIGKIDADKNVQNYAKYFLLKDTRVTEEDFVKVSNYTKIHNANELYDYLKYLWSMDYKNPYISATGSTLNIPTGWDLLIDRTIAAPVIIDNSAKTIQVKADRIEPTDNINVIENEFGIIHSATDEYIAMPYIDKNNDSYVSVVNLQPKDSVAVYDASWNLQYSGTGVYGFPYFQNPATQYFITIFKEDGTVAAKRYTLDQAGLKNEYKMKFNSGVGEFTPRDRITLYEVPEITKDRTEQERRLLQEIQNWVRLLEGQLKKGYIKKAL